VGEKNKTNMMAKATTTAKATAIAKSILHKTRPTIESLTVAIETCLTLRPKRRPPIAPMAVAAGGAGKEPESILSVAYWKNTNTFKAIKDKETQIKYYKKMNSSEEVLQLVDLESKPFGSESEKIIQEIFKLGPRTSTQNDGTRHGKKIEIKSARYWAGKDDCVWQHLEPEHDYEFAMLALLDFHGWKIWCIKKSQLMGELRDKKVVTFQGKQGWWTRKSAILPYLTAINSIEELDAFILS
jgi:hypothetical protein